MNRKQINWLGLILAAVILSSCADEGGDGLSGPPDATPTGPVPREGGLGAGGSW
jgi:hypothetical protein